jgi:hypothetical protein
MENLEGSECLTVNLGGCEMYIIGVEVIINVVMPNLGFCEDVDIYSPLSRGVISLVMYSHSRLLVLTWRDQVFPSRVLTNSTRFHLQQY